MGRYRSRSRSYSPRRSRTPPRRKHYDDPRDRRRDSRSSYRDRRSPAPSGLLVRNVALDTRPEDLRIPFEKFGPVKDVYLPRNYYTGEPRGFGFVKFRYPEDAAEAKDRLNHAIIGGREIRIVFAEENRKTPQEMRKTPHTSSGRYGGRRRTPPRSPRRRYRSYSRSPSSERRHSRSVSRSHSPRNERDYRSSRKSLSPPENSPDRREYKNRDRSRSARDISPRDDKGYRSATRSHSPREMSPHEENYRSSSKLPSSREKNSFDGKELRSTRRSVSPSEEFPHESKQRTPNSKEVSQHDEDYNKRLPSPRGSSRRGQSSQKSPSPRDLSPVDERGYKSKHWSPSRGENGKSPLRGRDLASSRSVSPRRNGRSVSRSPSRSYSPR